MHPQLIKSKNKSLIYLIPFSCIFILVYNDKKGKYND